MGYTIKEVSEKTGISAHTLRFYEKEGLLPDIERNANGVRMYCDDNITWIETVQALRSTGLPLTEIKQYLELYRSKDSTLEQRKELLLHQKNKVEDQISRLIKTLEILNYKLALLDAQGNKFERLP